MNYIVFDLEWNQPSSKSEKITDPFPFCGEIIQIGAVRLDEKFNITGTLNLMVKPVFYTKMHSVVKKLTGIGNDRLMTGVPFGDAYARFVDFCGDEFCLLSWGNDDILVLRDNMRIHEISTESFPATSNLQRIFGRQIAKTKKQLSLESAVAMLGEPPYCAHDALNDAISAALVCRHLDLAAETNAPKGISKKRRLQKV